MRWVCFNNKSLLIPISGQKYIERTTKTRKLTYYIFTPKSLNLNFIPLLFVIIIDLNTKVAVSDRGSGSTANIQTRREIDVLTAPDDDFLRSIEIWDTKVEII